MTPIKQTVFIETSIQIARILPSPLPIARIEELLTDPSITPITTAYVWMEYQRTIIADYAHVYRMIGRCPDWGDLFAHILDGSHGFRPRAAVRCAQIVGQLYKASQQRYELARYLCGSQISNGLRQAFWNKVTAYPDVISCDLVTKGIARQQDHTYAVAASCRKERAMCHLPELLAKHKSRLQLLLGYLAAHPHTIKDQPRLERLLTIIINEPHAALGQTSCWPLGDIIIALQVPPGASLWTLDKDFTTIAQALDIPLHTP